MDQPRDRDTEDENVPGTSEPATPYEDVTDARADGSAADLVGTADDGARVSLDGVYGDDEPADPAFAAVIEAGGGVSEGFEQSEAALVEHATDSEGSTRAILFDAIDEDLDVDDDVYGEADDIL